MNIKNNYQYMFNTVQSDLIKYNNTKVRIIRPLTEAEADLEDVGPMYKVQYHDGYIGDVFEDELSENTLFIHLLNEEEQKNIELVDYAIVDKSGEVVWVLSEKGKEFIFSDFDPDYEDEYIVNNVPFKRYNHYLSVPSKNEEWYEAFAWYNPKESYVESFKNINKAINWLLSKE